jgi:hypothetical protein
MGWGSSSTRREGILFPNVRPRVEPKGAREPLSPADVDAMGNDQRGPKLETKMLTKTGMALTAALIVGAASMALAADEETGGFRQLGSGGTVTDGVNPVDHPSISGAPKQAQPRTVGRSDGPSKGISAVERAERRDNTEDDRTGGNSGDR